MKNQKYLTQKEFADLKGVSRQTVHSLIKTGKINTAEIYGKKLIVLDRTAKEWKAEPGKRNDLKGAKK